MLHILLISILVTLSAPALAIYKCESSGKVSYSQFPCPSGNSEILSGQANDNPPLSEVGQARQQAAQDKHEATRLQKTRHQREAKEEKEQQRIARVNAAKRKKCAALALRKKWTADDALSASGRAAEGAKRKAQRAAEKYEMECGK
jgi:hypothetical protein